MEDTRTTLFNLIKEQFVIDYVDGTESLVNTLGADSLDKIELAVSLEDTFEIELNYDKLDKVSTVEDLYTLIKKQVDANRRKQAKGK